MRKLTIAAAAASNALASPRIRGIMAARNEPDTASVLATLNTAFTEFRSKNDEAIAALQRGQQDVVRTEELTRINDAITQATTTIETLQAQVAAGAVGGNQLSPEAREHATAFNAWFRRGGEGAEAGLRDLEVRAALGTQSHPDGGFLVPEEMDATISRVLATVSAIRSISRVVSISGNEYDLLISQGGAAAGWVGEEDARSTTASAQLAKISIDAGDLYANPLITQRLLDDASLDVAQWLADEVAITFAEKEGAAFVSGDGFKKPKGFLAETPVANASYAWGKIGFVATGTSGAFATAGADNLIALYYALKAGYRNGAAFVMSDATQATVRTFKDTTNNYIWAPPTMDMPATILGKPVVTDDNMPAVAANSFSVAFGNFQRGYMVVDRLGTRVLRDPFTNKPYVGFYTTKRVGGGVTNFEAIKTLKFV